MSNIYISCDAEEALTDYLVSCGHTVIKVETTKPCVRSGGGTSRHIYVANLAQNPKHTYIKAIKKGSDFVIRKISYTMRRSAANTLFII